jgi:hypothetical protein
VLQAIVDFEMALFTAQVKHRGAGNGNAFGRGGEDEKPEKTDLDPTPRTPLCWGCVSTC